MMLVTGYFSNVLVYRNVALTVRDGRNPRWGRRCGLRRGWGSLLGGLQRDEWIVKDEIQLAIRGSLHFKSLGLLLLLMMVQALILMIKLGPLRFGL